MPSRTRICGHRFQLSLREEFVVREAACCSCESQEKIFWQCMFLKASPERRLVEVCVWLVVVVLKVRVDQVQKYLLLRECRKVVGGRRGTARRLNVQRDFTFSWKPASDLLPRSLPTRRHGCSRHTQDRLVIQEAQLRLQQCHSCCESTVLCRARGSSESGRRFRREFCRRRTIPFACLI